MFGCRHRDEIIRVRSGTCRNGTAILADENTRRYEVTMGAAERQEQAASSAATATAGLLSWPTIHDGNHKVVG